MRMHELSQIKGIVFFGLSLKVRNHFIYLFRKISEIVLKSQQFLFNFVLIDVFNLLLV